VFDNPAVAHPTSVMPRNVLLRLLNCDIIKHENPRQSRGLTA
jgi:hypothetical protein